MQSSEGSTLCLCPLCHLIGLYFFVYVYNACVCVCSSTKPVHRLAIRFYACVKCFSIMLVCNKTSLISINYTDTKLVFCTKNFLISNFYLLI
jgi:hypothetical protein